jgi:hypothetical protein
MSGKIPFRPCPDMKKPAPMTTDVGIGAGFVASAGAEDEVGATRYGGLLFIEYVVIKLRCTLTKR